MKKIILLFFLTLLSSYSYSQLTENFDGTTALPDASGNWALSSGTWIVVDNLSNAAPNWEFSPATYPGNGGAPSVAAFIQRENTGQGVLSEEWLITPQVALLPSKQLRFFTSQTVTGDTGTIYQVRLSSNSNPLNLGSYAVLAQYTETQLSTLTPSQLDYEEKIVNLNLNGNWHIAFVKVFTQPGAATSGDRWLVDDVTIVDRCVEPSTFNVTNITADSATLEWTGTADSYDIEYGIQGFTPNTGSGTVVSGVTDLFYNIPEGSLSPGTLYDFYVTSNCDNSSSQVTGPFVFITLNIGAVCSNPIIIDAIPYFDESSTTIYGNNIEVPFIDDTNCGVTNYYLGGDDVVYTYTAPANTSGVIDITMNPLGNLHSAVYVYASCEDIGEDCLASAGGDFGNTIRNISDFNISPGQTIYIVISSSEFNGSISYQLLIQEALCETPNQLTALATGTGSADLSWQQTGGPTAWEVYVQNVGEGLPASPGTAAATSTNFPVSTLTESGSPLVVATQYQYWVRANCGDGNFGVWVGPYIFSTAPCDDFCYYKFVIRDKAGDGWDPNQLQIVQNGFTVGVVGENFIDGSGPFELLVPLCNGPYEVILDNFDLTFIDMEFDIINPFNQRIFTYDYVAPQTSFTLYTGTADCDTPLEICLPPVDLTATSLTLTTATLSWVPQGPDPLSYDVYVVLAGSPPPAVDTAPTLSTTTNSVFIDNLVMDTDYDYYVRAVCSFAGDNNWSTAFGFTTLDNCAKPTNLSFSNATVNSVEIDWVNGDNETEWEYIVLPEGSPAPDGTTSGWVSTTSHPVTVDNLEVNTQYDIYVRSDCGDGTFSNPTNALTVNTLICLPEDQCLYTFTLSDFSENGWVLTETLMEVYQNGILVATLGSTFSSGASQQIEVPICDGVPFELFWSQGGVFSNGTGISITNPDGQVIYEKTDGVGQPGDTLYFGTGQCTPTTCNVPTAIVVNNATVDSASFSWTENNNPAATSWDIIVLPATEPAPLQGVTGWTNVTTNPYVFTGLEVATTYKVYVRSICADGGKSYWSIGKQFSTLSCSPNNQCEYTFIMGDNVQGAWSNSTIQIIQNGIVIYTLSGPALGSNTESVIVGLCNNQPFELLWNTVGLGVGNVSLQVQDPDGTEVYGFEFEEAVDLNLFGTLLYTGSTDCTPPDCPAPIQVTATNITTSEVTVTWTESGTASAYEILVLTAGSAAPLPTDNGISATNPYTITNLNSGILYDFYVRAVCSDTEVSSWTLPYGISLPVPNDECSDAIELTVNAGVDCVQSTSGTLTGATQSSQPTSCTGTADDDVWYKFTATNAYHAVTFSNITGTNFDFQPMRYAIYEGANCQSLNLFLCTGYDEIPMYDLIPGDTYYIRVYSATSIPNQPINFDICVVTTPPTILALEDQFTPEQLISEVLTNSDCSTVSNVTFSTGTQFNADNGIAYFERNNATFPFENGIILSTGTTLGADSPNVSGGYPQNDPYDTVGFMWPGDADLDQLLVEEGLTETSTNATLIEFDFIPLTNNISFNYILASREYGLFQCNFSDIFAFLLTDVATGITTNLAVIPNTTTLVSVTNIHDGQYYTGPAEDNCGSANPEYFDTFYNLPQGVNPLLAPFRYDGMTIPLTATSPVVAGGQYHIKLVVADYDDTAVDTAIFLEGGSFSLGSVNLGADLLQSTNTAVCFGDTVVLDAQFNSPDYVYEWSQNGSVIPNETGSTLSVTEPGEYAVTATLDDSVCNGADSIIVEYYEEIVAGEADDILICDVNSSAIFDLTQNSASILGSLGANYSLLYFDSESSLNSGSSIPNPESYTNISNPQTIYVKLTNDISGCFETLTFSIETQDLTPNFNLPEAVVLCNNNPETISITPTNFDLADATYVWTLDGTTLSETGSSLVVSQAGLYEVTVSILDCSTTQSVIVSLGGNVTPQFDLNENYCQDDVAEELPNNSDNGITGTWSPLSIDTSTGGVFDYIFTSDATNCFITYTMAITVIEKSEFEITGDCEGSKYVLRSNPINDSSTNNVSYQWTDNFGSPLNDGNSSLITVTAPGVYNLETTTENCTSIASFTVASVACSVQKGISPNGDNKNDFFDLESFDVNKLSIFNRYGSEVYTQTNYTNQWVGQSNKGEELPDATYYYVIQREGKETLTGWIYINREY